MSGNLRPREQECIVAVLDLLRAIETDKIEEPSWIDGVEDGSALPEAVAQPYVIEHFSIETLPNQTLNSVRFLKVVGGIEAEFKGKLGYRLAINWPENAVTVGQNWQLMRESLRRWIKEEATNLNDGPRINLTINGLPFPVNVEKAGPLKYDGVIFARSVGEHDSDELSERLRYKLTEKLEKLEAHKYRAPLGLLIVESSDIALMSPHHFLQAFAHGFPNHDHTRVRICFADTSITGHLTVLCIETGRLFLFNRKTKLVEVETWIEVDH